MEKRYRTIWCIGRKPREAGIGACSGGGGDSAGRGIALLATGAAFLALSALPMQGWAAGAVCVDAANLGTPLGVATGANAVACGQGATAGGANAVAIGNAASTTGNSSVTSGDRVSTNMGTTVVIGSVSSATDTPGGLAGFGSNNLLGYQNILRDTSRTNILGSQNQIMGNAEALNATKSNVIGHSNQINQDPGNTLKWFKTSTVIGSDNDHTGGRGGINNIESSHIIGNQNTVTGSGLERVGLFGSNQSKLRDSILLGNGNTMTDTRMVAVIGGGTRATNSYSSFVTGISNTLRNADSSTIIGIGNTIDMTNAPSVNAWTGLPGNTVQNNIIGVSNTIRDTSTQNTVIGSSNTLGGTSMQNLVVGFRNTLGADLEGNQILASGGNVEDGVQDGVLIGRGGTLGASRAVVLGQGARAAVEGGVALGSSSRADEGASTVSGYDISTGGASTDTSPVWRGTHGAVAVGDVDNGITRRITDVAAGSDDTDAVNVAQLKAVNSVAQNANQGWNIGGNPTDPALGTVAPGERVDFISGDKSNTTVEVKDSAAAGQTTVTITTAKSPLQYTDTKAAAGGNTANADQFAATDQVTLVGAGGTTNKGVSLNNVAPAALSTESLQAVNGSQLFAVGDSTAKALGGTSTFDTTSGRVIAGLTVGGNSYNSVQSALDNIAVTAGSGWKMTTGQTGTGTVSGTSLETVAPGSTGTFTAGDNIAITQKGPEVQIATSMAPTFNTVTATGQMSAPTYVATGANPVIVSGNAGTINGLTNRTFDPANYTSGQAATEDQLAQVDGKVNQGWTLSANGKNPSQVGPGQTVDFRNTDGNIRIGKAGNNLTFNLNPNLRLNSVTTGDTQINTNGLFIKGGPSVSKTGIDAAGQKVTNVADGTAPNDAINRGQLDELDARLSREIGKVDDRASAGVASAMASASVPQATIPGANLLGAGTGYYNGHSALAIGYSAMSDNGRWIIRSNVSVNSEDAAVSAGIGYQW